MVKKKKYGFSAVLVVVPPPAYDIFIENFDSGWDGLVIPDPQFNPGDNSYVENFDSGWDGV
jgi:hypothetical protein